MLRAVLVISLATGLSFTIGCLARVDQLHQKEALLKEDLYSLRQAIDQYTQDKNKAPQDLNDLVRAGYVRGVPKDPFTNSSEIWQTVPEDGQPSDDRNRPGIIDVHSGSDQVSSDGSRDSNW